MSSPEKTIRLQNTSFSNLSLMLAQLRPVASGTLKRGPMMTPALIKQGAYYDVCKELGVTFEDARRIIAQSPEVRMQKEKNRLLIIEFPPPPPPPPPEPRQGFEKTGDVPQTKNDEPSPVESATTVDVVNATTQDIPNGEQDLQLEADKRVAEALDAPQGVLSDEELERLTAPEVPRKVREPSMDWSEDELREYAKARGIDVSKAKSKTAVLKTIRGK